MISSISMFFSEAVIFALYIFVCLTLLKPRFSLTIRVSIYIGIVLCSCEAVMALALNGKTMAALTLLPLIAYLPFSVCVYVLSEGGIFECAAACSVGALASIIVKTIKKMLNMLLFKAFFTDIRGAAADMIISGIVFVFVSAVAFAAFRFARKPFEICMRSDLKNRLVALVSTVTLLLAIFFNLNSAVSVTFSIITLIIAVSFLVIVALMFIYSARIAEADAKERILSENLEQQRKGFEQLSQSIDAGRIYRHDMRHHLKVLSGLAWQDNSVEIIEYLENLSESAELSIPETFCRNPAINAVLSEYINRADMLCCRTKLKISVPEELPFELPDVCIILSNALENALNACEKCSEDKRYFDLLADFSDECKLKISVKNSCADGVRLDAEGLPVVEECADGHGIGLRGVKKTVEKYNGFICCTCENGEFHFCAEIFRISGVDTKKDNICERSRKQSKALPAVLTALICAVGIVNFSPASASALSEVFSVDIKTFSYGWGDNSLSVQYPEFSGDNSEKPNQVVNDFIAGAQEIFWEYALQKYEGYTALDAGYRVYINDRTYLSVRFFATINAGGSAEFSRCMVMDKQSGEVLALADLFGEERDYIAEISAKVLQQMEMRVEYWGASYFIPGGIWTDDECFKEISPEQEFYINEYGQLVIVFDEYTVADGREGSPEFVMPDEIFNYHLY